LRPDATSQSRHFEQQSTLYGSDVDGMSPPLHEKKYPGGQYGISILWLPKGVFRSSVTPPHVHAGLPVSNVHVSATSELALDAR